MSKTKKQEDVDEMRPGPGGKGATECLGRIISNNGKQWTEHDSCFVDRSRMMTASVCHKFAKTAIYSETPKYSQNLDIVSSSCVLTTVNPATGRPKQ